MKNHCTYFKDEKCRSCTHLDSEFADALAQKVKLAFECLGDLSGVVVKESIYLENPFNSRNKARLIVSGDSENPILGIPAPENKFKFNELLECPLHLDGINEALLSIKNIIKDYKITPYDVNSRTGELKYVIVYKSESSGEFYYRFVLRSREALDRLRMALPLMQRNNPLLRVVSCNLQPKPMAIHEGEEEIFLTDKKVVLNSMNGIVLPISPQSFFQVTSQIAQKLYLEVLQSIKTDGRVLDLFCGVGGFALHVAKKSKSVIGVELSKSAIDCATSAISLNGLENVEFYAQDAFLFLKKYVDSFDTIIVNPPRRGLGGDVTSLIEELSPKTLFYSSCNPETFAKDRILLKNYRLKWLRPFDMFPYSDHLEVLGEFERIS